MSKYKDKLDGKELDLGMCSLSTISVRDIALLPRATSLNLSYNRLTQLPSNFCSSLTHLTRLDLSNNSLTELPDDFGSLVNLKHLDLLGNQLTLLPLTFGELAKLKWLDVKDNPLNPVLHSVAGDCLNDAECRKCASLLVSYMKQFRADFERLEEAREIRRAEREAARLEVRRQKEKAKKLLEKEKRRREHETNRILEASA
ncbi:leucine-rich repeat-containing protein 59, partial [Octopus bimaculoides]